MALFRQSTLPWATAVQQIAAAAGASGDDEMRNLAHLSLRASFQIIGSKTRWDFLRGEYPVQIVTGPFSVGGVSATAGSVSASCVTGHGIAIDDIVSASGYLYGTRVTLTAASGFNTSVAPTAGGSAITATFTRDMYDAPSGMRALGGQYSAKLLLSQRPLNYIKRRAYDRSVTDEYTAGDPYWYDLFMLGSASKVRLVPPPAGSNLLQQRFYRTFTMAPASASAASAALDIPEDYEYVPIAWAKWHFLTDKGDGRKDQANVWMTLAQDGLKQMLAEQTALPDDNLGFVPGALPFWWDSRSTSWIQWDYV